MATSWLVSAQRFCAAAAAVIPSQQEDIGAGGWRWHGAKPPSLEPPLGVPTLGSRHDLPGWEKQISSPTVGFKHVLSPPGCLISRLCHLIPHLEAAPTLVSALPC